MRNNLSQPELNQRIRDVLLNVPTVTPNGVGIGTMKIAGDAISNETTIWFEKWTHMLEEMKLRHGPYPGGFTPEIMTKEPLPDFKTALKRAC